jgi:cell division control protein 45
MFSFLILIMQIYNIPKLFGLEHGGDFRCFILDNHRPVHLANIHSNHQVVVLNDGSIVDDNVPSDGSDLSGDESDSCSDDGTDEYDQVVVSTCLC